MMNYKGMILMMMLLVGVAYSDSQVLPNFQQPKHHIYTAGQPTDAGFRTLQSMGVKVVINVLPAEECLAGEDVLPLESYPTAMYRVITISPFQSNNT
jgi:hypothetical protein